MARLDATARGAIEAALNAADMTRALALADAALAAGVGDALLFNLVAWRAEERFDFAAAHAALAAAMALAPMDATIVTAAGRALRKEGRVGEAVTMLVRASALDPGFAVPWLERGFALDAAGDTRGAAASYARAAALDPGLAPAHAGAAAMALRGGDPDAAVALAHAALTRNPASPVATLTLAAIEARTDPAAAIARLTALLAGPRGDDDRALALTGLGDASDRAGATAAAFAAWTAANTVIARRHAPRFAGHEPQRALIARIAAQVAATPADEWVAPAVAPGPAAGHVFLLGYPRSGTTLVENVLASSPDVVAL